MIVCDANIRFVMGEMGLVGSLGEAFLRGVVMVLDGVDGGELSGEDVNRFSTVDLRRVGVTGVGGSCRGLRRPSMGVSVSFLGLRREGKFASNFVVEPDARGGLLDVVTGVGKYAFCSRR